MARKTWFAVGAIALLVVGLTGGLAQAAAADEPSEMDLRVEAILDEFPGGTRIADNQVSWDDGAVVLTLESNFGGISPFSIGTCATGTYCVYSGTNLTGSKLAFSSCSTTVSTAPVGTVRSIANARGSGYVQAKNSGGSVLATVYAGGQLSSAPTATTQLTCFT